MSPLVSFATLDGLPLGRLIVLEGYVSFPLAFKMRIVDEVVARMRFPVRLLNVTRLTSFRKDAHPSLYGMAPDKRRNVSKRKQDCSHWCLPGVPDAWNELIYASLVLEPNPRSWDKL